MERAIRVVSVQRGFDPRDFALLAFGGAGGMHACELAETLDIATVIVPRHAGVLSALGMLLADVTKDYSLTILRAGDAIDAAELATLFAPLVARGRARPGARRIPAAIGSHDRARGSTCATSASPTRSRCRWRRASATAFDRRHARTYGYADPRRAIEVVTLRVVAVGRTDKPALPRARRRPAVDRRAVARAATARFDGALVADGVLSGGDDLRAGRGRATGPR